MSAISGAGDEPPGVGIPPAAAVSAEPGEGVAPVHEDPALLAANLNAGVRLFASAVAFVFVGFVFAFFYLRAVNSNGLWRPPHTSPSLAYGIVMLVCVLGATATFVFGRRALAADRRPVWLAGVGVSLVLGVIVVILQVLQYTNYSFSPESGGYASVFVGWTVLFLLFWLGALYWMETFLAQTLRRDPHPSESEISRPLDVLGPSAAACLVYLSVLAVIEIVAFILLYLVK